MKLTGQKETVQKILRHLKKYRLLLAASILLAVFSVVLTLYIPILIGNAIDVIVYGRVEFGKIAAIIGTILIVSAVTGLIQWLMNVINNRMAYFVVRDIRNEAFQKIEVLPLKYLDAHSQGDILSRVIADADQFADGLLMGVTQLFTGVVTILGTLGFMLSMNAKITLVVVLVTPLSLFVARFIARKTFLLFREQSEARGEQTAFIDEMISNEKVVKAFSREQKALAQFDGMNERLQKASLRAIFFSSLTNPSTRFVNSVVYAGVGLTGAVAVLNGGMTVGVMSCFLSYANQYTKPFNEISGVVTELQNAVACAARIFELIEEEAQEPDKPEAEELTDAQGIVSCRNVEFSYVPDKPLIENLNVRVKSGEKVAIVGPTGCGKTTIINLLMRFYDVDNGGISVDGTDIRDLTRKSLRTSYGMVLQETWLRNGTIRDNIIMGKPEAAEEEIIAAAKEAHAHSFIRRLPQGYDTVIGEDGGMLSQGQKQLLCITRVMLCLPPMLILDEATSSIDTRTEMKIQSAFQKLMNGKTSFIVAHRLSTIQNADVILVMRDGKIIEQGSHDDLLQKNGFYTSLYNSQFA